VRCIALHTAADVKALLDETQALKLRAHVLARALYTAGRETDSAPAPPLPIGLSGLAFAAEGVLERSRPHWSRFPRKQPP
jgi:hypothetical protein